MIRDAQHRAGYETPIKLQKLNATTAACRGISVRIRTGESVRELSDWNFVTTLPESAQAGRRRPFGCGLHVAALESDRSRHGSTPRVLAPPAGETAARLIAARLSRYESDPIGALARFEAERIRQGPAGENARSLG
jgi:hypothetical protein